MIYWFTVFSKWFEQVHALFFAVLLADALLIGIYFNGISLTMPSTINSGYKFAGQAFALVIFGPLINLYGFYHCWKIFWNEEADLYDSWNNVKPNFRSRKILSCLFGPVLAMIYIPPLFWFYTNGVATLWGKERNFFDTPGFYLSLVLALVIGFLFQLNNKEFKKYQTQIKGKQS